MSKSNSADPVKPPFSRLVSERMREKGLGLRELCRAVGVDASFFSKVLAEKRSPPSEDEVLRKIADALDLDPRRVFVAAGRIPSEWARLWSEPALIGVVSAAVEEGARPSMQREAPRERPKPRLPERGGWARRPAPPPRRREDLGEELL